MRKYYIYIYILWQATNKCRLFLAHPQMSVQCRGDRDTDTGSSDNQGIVVGLSLALGLTLVVIGGLAVWKFKVRKNARRLMEDMGEGDL